MVETNILLSVSMPYYIVKKDLTRKAVAKHARTY